METLFCALWITNSPTSLRMIFGRLRCQQALRAHRHGIPSCSHMSQPRIPKELGCSFRTRRSATFWIRQCVQGRTHWNATTCSPVRGLKSTSPVTNGRSTRWPITHCWNGRTTWISAIPLPSEYVPIVRQRFVDHSEWDTMCDAHALPRGWERMDYQDFLTERRRLMAGIIRRGLRQVDLTRWWCLLLSKSRKQRYRWLQAGLPHVVRTRHRPRGPGTGARQLR